jgi:predicted site-specific integrase-resolvase
MERKALLVHRDPRLSVRDLMERYGCSRQTIYEWRRLGKISHPARDPGGKRLRWRKSWLDALDERNSRGTEGEASA